MKLLILLSLYNDALKRENLFFCKSLEWAFNWAATKISSSHVQTTSRQGIKRLGISIGSIFVSFFYESSLQPLWQPCFNFVIYCVVCSYYLTIELSESGTI